MKSQHLIATTFFCFTSTLSTPYKVFYFVSCSNCFPNAHIKEHARPHSARSLLLPAAVVTASQTTAALASDPKPNAAKCPFSSHCLFCSQLHPKSSTHIYGLCHPVSLESTRAAHGRVCRRLEARWCSVSNNYSLLSVVGWDCNGKSVSPSLDTDQSQY